MADRLSAQARSAHMARIRRSDTAPERIVRRLLHNAGYRYRLQFREVPGRPDIAFPKKHKAIFVHGCFWHAHQGCPIFRVPKSRTEFWEEKFAKNKERDARQLREVQELGWKALVVWECETKHATELGQRLKEFLGPPKS